MRLLRFRFGFASRLLAMAALFLFVFIPISEGAKGPAQDSMYDEVELLAEAITIIQSDYVNEVEPKKLVYGALKGLVESLDRHSQFLDPNAYSEMQVETKGEFGGVGLEISIAKDGFLTVITPIDDTPASAAGIKPQDKVVKIDGQTTRGITLHEAVKRLRGRPGTKVNLTILRERENHLLDVVLARAVIKIRSVKEARMVADRIGYIRITEFQDNTPRDLKKALETLEQTKMDGFILDLRNNPGGLLDVAIEVAEMFIPSGKRILTTKGRIKSQNLEFVSKLDHPHTAYPMVILVNGGSASASEIVAGALRDHRRGILMGTRTFGKGSVQTVIPLKDGSAIRLTTSLYYTPSGQSIHGEGLEPDVVVEEKESKEPAEEGKLVPEEEKLASDPMILRAIDLMKGLKVYETSQ
ncbi:MAG: S41 family peptidase [Candidatus Omnitrophica bacterium]|nr:S41 family peptidase [Candidatus Omnitrophota bacterium]